MQSLCLQFTPVDVYVYVEGPTLSSTIAKSDFNVLNYIFAFVE